jgi:hypothetical protein
MFGTHVRHGAFRALSVPPVSGSAHYERIRHAHACATSVDFMVGALDLGKGRKPS